MIEKTYPFTNALDDIIYFDLNNNFFNLLLLFLLRKCTYFKKYKKKSII